MTTNQKPFFVRWFSSHREIVVIIIVVLLTVGLVSFQQIDDHRKDAALPDALCDGMIPVDPFAANGRRSTGFKDQPRVLPRPGSPLTECENGAVRLSAYPLAQVGDELGWGFRRLRGGTVPLGPGLQGMASSSAAWLVTPCQGDPLYVEVAKESSYWPVVDADTFRRTLGKLVRDAAAQISTRAGCGTPPLAQAAVPAVPKPQGDRRNGDDPRWSTSGIVFDKFGDGPACGLVPAAKVKALSGLVDRQSMTPQGSVLEACDLYVPDQVQPQVTFFVVHGALAQYTGPHPDFLSRADSDPVTWDRWVMGQCGGEPTRFVMKDQLDKPAKTPVDRQGFFKAQDDLFRAYVTAYSARNGCASVLN